MLKLRLRKESHLTVDIAAQTMDPLSSCFPGTLQGKGRGGYHQTPPTVSGTGTQESLLTDSLSFCFHQFPHPKVLSHPPALGLRLEIAFYSLIFTTAP